MTMTTQIPTTSTDDQLHALWQRLHPETGDHAMTRREAMRALLEEVGAHRTRPTDAGAVPEGVATGKDAAVRAAAETVRSRAGSGAGAGPEGQAPTT